MKFIIYVLLFISIISCNNRDICKEFELDDKVYTAIVDYINKNSQYNTFIIMELPYVIPNKDSKIQYEFLLGPFYKNILDDTQNKLYYNILGKRVYLKTNFASIFKRRIDDSWNNTNPKDSLKLPSGYNTNESVILYIHKSILLQIEKTENLIINYRPDSLILPKDGGVIYFKEQP